MKTVVPNSAGLLAGSCLALLLGGCVMWPQFGEPGFVGPPESPILTAEQSPTDRARDNSGITHLPGQGADQADIQLIFLPRIYPEAREPQRSRAPQPRALVEAPALPTDSLSSSASDSVPAAAKPPVTVAPRGVEAEERDVRADLAEAQRLLRGFDSLDLIRSDKEKLRTVYSLIAQAEDALERRDVAPAAGLARKARLLAEELGSP
jgi:hypothetical protein